MSKRQKLKDRLADCHPDTQAIRAGHVRTEEGEHSEAIFTTSSYVFDSAQQAADRFTGENPGNVYSRYTNPSVATFEDRIAALEGSQAAVATSSGMAAILAVCMALLQEGDHVVCSSSVFGTTTTLFGKFMEKFGVVVSRVPLTDLSAWKEACGKRTRLLFAETPSNPLNEVGDIAALAELAESCGALLAIDNCFCTPALQKPLALGAHIVTHSATKYLDGQGRCLGGSVCADESICDEVLGFIRTCGTSLSPFNAWVFTKGLETLRLRMDAHSANAMALAEWLLEQDAVEQVYYAGLSSHPGHRLAARQQRGFGGVLSFKVGADEQSREAAWKVIDATRFLSITANLGDVKTTIVHPATTTHGRLSDADKQAAGITENLIRVAVGLEDIGDIKADLSHGLTPGTN